MVVAAALLIIFIHEKKITLSEENDGENFLLIMSHLT